VWVGEGDHWPVDDDAVLAAFEAEYRRIYGLTIPDVSIEVVTWRLSVSAAVEGVTPESLATGVGATPTGSRPVVFGRGRESLDTPVYRRADLGAGARFEGPAIVEERETTAVIRPVWRVEVGADGRLVATRDRGADASVRPGAGSRGGDR
jgi:N-methylhydantoinase A